MRISDSNIRVLKREIFVFGSNLQGLHLGGAALFAHDRLEAKMGVPEGLTGHCYAIPTVNKVRRDETTKVNETLSVEEIKPYVNRFMHFAQRNPHLTFLVTELGCGIAGHKVEDIAPLFYDAYEIENIHLPESFWKHLSVVEMTEDEWFEKFDPVDNIMAEDSSFNGCMFETYGEEFSYIQEQNLQNIWTLIEGDEGSVITNGMHYVNRLGYFISKTPWRKGEFYDISLDGV